MKAKYSIVVPVYNEEETIEKFYEAIIPVMDKLSEPYEVIYVNDGSRDSSWDILTKLANKDKRVKIVNFSKNFGQQAALLCGFKHAEGDAVIDIDVDLQDPVEVIPEMIAKWKEGFDVVHGRRKSRAGETFFKKATSTLYHKFLKKITNMQVPEHTGDFKLFDRKVIDTICSLKEQNRFLRGLTTWVGFKQTFVDFDRHERVAGTTKYTVKKLVNLASNGIVAYTHYPLFIGMKIGIAGIILSCIAFVTFIVLAICGIVLPLVAWLFPTVVLLFSLGYVFNGLSNTYLGRVYDEVKGRPNYIVRDEVNFGENNENQD